MSNSIITKCPVCFTKMNFVGHDLVCPECGYKYCERKDPYSYDDHNHNEYRSYNQKTSYTDNNHYTATPAKNTSTHSNESSARSANNNSASASQSPANRSKAFSPVKLIIGIIIFYFICAFIMSIGGFLYSLFNSDFLEMLRYYMMQ